MAYKNLERISTWEMNWYWTRILRASANLLLAITWYTDPIGVLGSPRILFDLAFERWMGSSTSAYPAEREWIERMIAAAPPSTSPFTSAEINVRQRPSGHQLAEWNSCGTAVAVKLRGRTVRALFLPCSVLARLWRESASPRSQFDSVWLNGPSGAYGAGGAIAWLYDLAGQPFKST